MPPGVPAAVSVDVRVPASASIARTAVTVYASVSLTAVTTLSVRLKLTRGAETVAELPSGAVSVTVRLSMRADVTLSRSMTAATERATATESALTAAASSVCVPVTFRWPLQAERAAAIKSKTMVLMAVNGIRR